MNTLKLSKWRVTWPGAGNWLAPLWLAALPFLVTPLRADNPPTYLLQWGNDGTMNIPWGVAVDSGNNVYVADFLADRINKFDYIGDYLTQFSSPGSGNGQLAGPQGVAVDSSNNLYVADSDNNRIQKFNSNGTLLTQWGTPGRGNGQFNSPSGIAIDSGNHVYVADAGNNRIQKFNSNGTFLAIWGSAGSGNGQFSGPAGIAVDSSNNVYVADALNYRIEKFSSNGTYLTQWVGPGSGDGALSYPEGIAVDKSNNVYVTDENSASVKKYTSNGSFLAQWGNFGRGNGEFSNPAGIAVDGSGNFIYVTETGNPRVQVFVNNPNIIGPIITNQPASQTIAAGANVTFSVGLLGSPPFAYQWNSNNIAIASATNATFTLTNVSLAEAASYSVLVSNSYGSESSSNAVLAWLPAVAETRFASSVTTNGAVLNGSVTVGLAETVVWFEWGTDTNYGNITGQIMVPGNNASNSISTALALPRNVYHYRMDASNDWGMVYGNDEVFAIGSLPLVTALPAINSPNGTALNATVNPNGLDTSVYFKWGLAVGSLTNLTPTTDAGAGVVPVNVSSFITGLAPARQYMCQVVASNYFGAWYGPQVTFYSPPMVSVPNENWDSVAASADGRVLVAVANAAGGASPAGPILISTNSGATWGIATGAPTNGFWETVACSADGRKIIAAGGGGGSFVFPIYTSPDMGVTWVSNNAPVANWQSVASSADGNRLVAADDHDQVIYTSTNSGAVWTQTTTAPKVGWFAVALSADGTKLAAVASGSTNIFTSPDFGLTWKTNNVPPGPQGIQRAWSAIAASADGRRLIAAAGGNGNSGYIFISTNFGAGWKLTATNIFLGLVAHPWLDVASSADGSRLAAVSDVASSSLGVLVTSTNSGATWMTNPVPNLTWNAVALSADGAKLLAAVGYPSTGPIYVSQTTPTPVLNLSAVGNVLSWTIPSLDFTLQQSSDLVSWSDVTNPPVLNLTNLQNQVFFPTPAGNSFFRLTH